MKAYEEVIDFIASGPSAKQVIDFRPSPTANERVAELIEREKARDFLRKRRRSWTAISNWSTPCGSPKHGLGSVFSMSSLVSEALRAQVAQRADYLCEYCLLAETDAFFRFEVIILLA